MIGKVTKPHNQVEPILLIGGSEQQLKPESKPLESLNWKPEYMLQIWSAQFSMADKNTARLYDNDILFGLSVPCK